MTGAKTSFRETRRLNPRQLPRSSCPQQPKSPGGHLRKKTAKRLYLIPYSACERGTNENANGLLRQYVSNETGLTTLDQNALTCFIRHLNNRPRKTLGYRTPNEVFKEALVALQG